MDAAQQDKTTAVLSSRRRTTVFVIVACALMMMAIDSTIVATALHALETDLQAPINWAGWTITAYALGFLVMLPVTGRLSEVFGRRRVFLVSVVTFTLASFLCGTVTSIYQLIVLRALQAAGGAGFTPSATGLVVDYFGDERDRAVSLFGSIFPIGAMIGPIFGGLFVSEWSWRGIFYVNVPIGVAVLLLSLRFIPADPVPVRKRRAELDWPGMALLGFGLLNAMLAAGFFGEPDARVGDVRFWLPGVTGLVLLLAFFRHIHRVALPFIQPSLITGRGFAAVNLVNVLYGGVRGGIIALVPLYAITAFGMTALEAGLLLVAQGIATVVFSVWAALRIRETGYRWPIAAGGAVVALGIGWLALPPVFGITPFWWLTLATLLVGAGGGFLNPASRNAGLQLVPEHSSTLAALRTMGLQIGSITTVSIATAILAVSADEAAAHARIFTCVAVLLLAGLVLVKRVPEHKGSW